MSEKLLSYLKENSVDAEHLVFEKSCHSVQEAADAIGTSPDNFVKSICMISNDKPIIAIVKGEDRASTSRVEKLMNIDRPKLATPEQILEMTGYPCGGTPPLGFNAIFLIDEKVMDNEFVYAGGGTEKSLLKISPLEIKRITNGVVGRIRK